MIGILEVPILLAQGSSGTPIKFRAIYEVELAE